MCFNVRHLFPSYDCPKVHPFPRFFSGEYWQSPGLQLQEISRRAILPALSVCCWREMHFGCLLSLFLTNLDCKESLDILDLYNILHTTSASGYLRSKLRLKCSFPLFFCHYQFNVMCITWWGDTVPGWSMTTVLLQVSQGRRPCLELIPEQRPRECDQIISTMKQCWDQEPRKRPQFSGADKEKLGKCFGSTERAQGLRLIFIVVHTTL